MSGPLKIELYRVGGTIEQPLANAQHDWSERRGIFLRIIDQEWGEGWGEASPLPRYSDDTLEQAYLALRNSKIELRSDFNLAQLSDIVRVVPASIPSARFALECALLDLLSRKESTSVSGLFRTASPRARCCGLLPASESPLASAHKLQARGISTAKLKVGRAWSQELRWIRELRAELPDLELRIDVNGAWSVAQAKARLDTLAELGLQFVEQPVQPQEMGELRDSPTPIAADESLRAPHNHELLQPLVESSALVAIVLKPTVLGGILASLHHRDWAQERGIAAIASHCFEGPVAAAALSEFALVLGGDLAHGIDSHAALSAFPDVSIPQLTGHGIQAFRPGLGVFPTT